ncbi:hypothetical protein C8D88_116198 [Lentzea atacamensis]|uniref:Uncharacterized protein n=1 Tax=Lentzea atacamensis TaxID=531938 RepID=A0A316HM33_9PSEU|nr:hypothetical protein C8D88_116198 [Lentzea atacamensis]RAS62989.1 hypothetical protein C8D87_107137 [Lentzea atacamensis]
MPVRSVPSDRKAEIEVLAADREVVVSQSWPDILLFRAGGFAWPVRPRVNCAVAPPARFTRTGRIQR